MFSIFLCVFFTVKSFVELTQYLFTVPRVKLFLSRRLSQDPLEQFFGCQRQRGGVHDNPNVVEFLNNSQVLRVVNSFHTKVGKGNCRGNVTDAVDVDLEKESLPLPTRKRKRPNDKENDLQQLKRNAP